MSDKASPRIQSLACHSNELSSAHRRALLGRCSAALACCAIGSAGLLNSRIARAEQPTEQGTEQLTEQPSGEPSGPIKVRDLYAKDRSFSDLVQSSLGERMTVRGFMAPPLKAESRFFVLTARPMTTCPFCSTEADWPDDIVAVYTKRTVRTIAFNIDIEVRGRLVDGAYTDPETRFVSLLRLEDATYERV